MKVVTVVGARPQFIKAAVVSHELRKKHQEILVHTGQHYDYNMSEKFFEELSIPKPDYNLGISGGTHAEMTGNMMIEIEKVLIKENPDWLLIYGDTNSTLAAALAGAKLYIPTCHVEACGRSYINNNPEEINRVCADHISQILTVCTESDMISGEKEGLSNKMHLVGDPMFDAFLKYSDSLTINDFSLTLLDGKKIEVPHQFYYMTCHREENTSKKALYEILSAMNQLEFPTIYPVHPRNKNKTLDLIKEKLFNNIILCEPIGYLESICLVNNAEKIVTDSGGLQREAFFAKKKCVTILESCSWKETFINNRNELSSANSEEILEKLSHEQTIDENYQPFGDGHSANKIVKLMEEKYLEF